MTTPSPTPSISRARAVPVAARAPNAAHATSAKNACRAFRDHPVETTYRQRVPLTRAVWTMPGETKPVLDGEPEAQPQHVGRKGEPDRSCGQSRDVTPYGGTDELWDRLDGVADRPDGEGHECESRQVHARTLVAARGPCSSSGPGAQNGLSRTAAPRLPSREVSGCGRCQAV